MDVVAAFLKVLNQCLFGGSE